MLLPFIPRVVTVSRVTSSIIIARHIPILLCGRESLFAASCLYPCSILIREEEIPSLLEVHLTAKLATGESSSLEFVVKLMQTLVLHEKHEAHMGVSCVT